jgi:hypothetical protein
VAAERTALGLQGVDELVKTFGELTRPTQRNALMRTLKQVIQPLADAVKSKAPHHFGDLEENLLVGTRLTRRQAAMSRKHYDAKATAELHFGTADPAGFLNEFQLGHNARSAPFFRPEWESRKYSIRDDIARTLGSQIIAAGERAFRRKRGR